MHCPSLSVSPSIMYKIHLPSAKLYQITSFTGTIANTALKMGRNFVLFGAKDELRTEMQFSALASQVTEP